MKVFKFKKYKDRYKNGMQGVVPRCPLEVGALLESQGLGRLAGHAASAAEARTSPSTLSSSATLSMTSLFSDAPPAKGLALATSEDAMLLTSGLSSSVALPVTSLPSDAPPVRASAPASTTSKNVVLPTSPTEASHKSKVSA